MQRTFRGCNPVTSFDTCSMPKRPFLFCTVLHRQFHSNNSSMPQWETGGSWSAGCTVNHAICWNEGHCHCVVPLTHHLPLMLLWLVECTWGELCHSFRMKSAHSQLSSQKNVFNRRKGTNWRKWFLVFNAKRFTGSSNAVILTVSRLLIEIL